MKEASEEQSGASAVASLPLGVDLDGTLIRTDAFLESVCRYCKLYPFDVFRFPFWLKKGKAYFKRRIAEKVNVDPGSLPYNEEVISFLKKEREQGISIVLATAADELVARPIANHVGLFDDVIASNGSDNYAGSAKAAFLEEKYGKEGFGYVGNEAKDIKVWKRAGRVLAVSTNKGFTEKVQAQVRPERVFEHDQDSPRELLRAIRVHQWVKNLLVFIPLIMAHRVLELDYLFPTIVAFLAYSLCASSVYLINDLLDIEADRAHPTKRNRPVASGNVSVTAALGLIPLLLVSSFVFSVALPLEFQLLLGAYFVITFSYSLWLKQIALIDILTLASLYALRILAGGMSTGIAVSEWLVAFSMFIFLSLACAKRYAELIEVRRLELETAVGRGYRAIDLELIGQLGASSGYISVLVLALYINSSQVVTLYHRPSLLWLVCPILLYWISRVWLIAHRGELHEDPIVFAIHDRASYLVGLLCGLVLLFAV